MIEWLKLNSEAISAMVSLLTMMSVLPAAIVFVFVQFREVRDRRETRVRELGTLYTDYLQLALENPRLRASEHAVPFNSLNEIASEEDRIRLTILFEILTSVFESAFFLYYGTMSDVRHNQWIGWIAYIDIYCERPDYREWWITYYLDGDEALLQDDVVARTQWDKRFEKFMHERLRKFLELERTEERKEVDQ